ncbi:Hypothetical predicted protein [Olea europaea subsp. europaea]|uniref:Transmembrane protein n=1 Tax=Olea europaea subsp. europaea TaxID=158383 RepID=A0A8S0QBZ9_OLEEU|nr:Hypothetical predicted protein [Olea europaea subsp. europaea]
MASLHFSVQSIPLHHRPCAGLQKSPLSTFGKNSSVSHFNFRFKNEGRLQVRPRLHPLFASNDNPSEGADETKRPDSAQGPPFLTILAGFLVFAFICWIIGSIVMWIISLIIYPPPSK